MFCIFDVFLEKGRLVEDIDVGCGVFLDEFDNVNLFILLLFLEKFLILIL